jgi:hypothetical protein
VYEEEILHKHGSRKEATVESVVVEGKEVIEEEKSRVTRSGVKEF